MRNHVISLALVVLTGCTSTHFTVRDSAGRPIPDAIAYHNTIAIEPSVSRTIVALTDDEGHVRMRGMPIHVAIGKKGYFPAVVSRYSFLFTRRIPVTLFGVDEIDCCQAGTAWNRCIYEDPIDVKASDAAAYAQWQEYLEWLDQQPPFRSLLPR